MCKTAMPAGIPPTRFTLRFHEPSVVRRLTRTNSSYFLHINIRAPLKKIRMRFRSVVCRLARHITIIETGVCTCQ